MNSPRSQSSYVQQNGGCNRGYSSPTSSPVFMMKSSINTNSPILVSTASSVVSVGSSDSNDSYPSPQKMTTPRRNNFRIPQPVVPALISPDQQRQQARHQQPQLGSVVDPNQQRLGYFYANRVVAIDCEMVGVGPGGRRSVLARVSVVDFFGNCLLDTFVRVNEKVTDYRTHISGITPQQLVCGTAMPFHTCRKLVQDLVRNKILVGHGLENDLKVLGLNHPWFGIRDTAFYEPYMRVVGTKGRRAPRKLKELAKGHLGILIQQPGLSHNSMEDACAAMLLYRQVQSQVCPGVS